MKKRAIIAAALAAAVLAATALWLALGESPIIQGHTELDGNAMNMVLIDIADQEALSRYHVTTAGVYVLAVDEAGDAYAAGVRSGDRIVSANGVEVDSSGEFSELSAALEPSAVMELVLERGVEAERFTVRLTGEAAQ